MKPYDWSYVEEEPYPDTIHRSLKLPVLVIGVALAVVAGWLLWMALGWRAGG